MNILNKIIIPLTTLLLTLISIWLITITITQSKSYYHYQFKKNDTAQSLIWTTEENEVISYTEEDLEIIMNQIIDYLFDKTDSMQVIIDGRTVFSNQAIKHMADVKAVYKGFSIIAYISCFLLVLCFIYLYYYREHTFKLLFKYSLITILSVIGILVILGIYMLIDFDTAFIYFHKVLFPDPQAFNDAFFGIHSNYDELPHINNTILIRILSIEIFATAGFLIIALTIILISGWLFITYKLKNMTFKKEA